MIISAPYRVDMAGTSPKRSKPEDDEYAWYEQPIFANRRREVHKLILVLMPCKHKRILSYIGTLWQRTMQTKHKLTIAPTPADQMSSVYRNGASADASTMEKDLSRQNKSKFAPPPRIASKAYCSMVGATQTFIAGTAQIRVVKKAV